MRGMSNLLIIAITLPFFFDHESDAITSLLSSGAFDRVHLRKPSSRESDLRALIEEIPQEYHTALSLHDHHRLAYEYGCGIHLNSRNPELLYPIQASLSRSCHSLDDISKFRKEDYLFLSPIFPSISKPGYTPSFILKDCRGKVDQRTIALGGVDTGRFNEIKRMGFGGAAMLGMVWNSQKEGNLKKLIEDIIAKR